MAPQYNNQLQNWVKAHSKKCKNNWKIGSTEEEIKIIIPDLERVLNQAYGDKTMQNHEFYIYMGMKDEEKIQPWIRKDLKD